MATPTTYTYSIQNDFPNHVVATDRLSLEISASNIVVALNYINTIGDACYVVFKDELNAEDHLILDSLVATHSGQSLPNEATSVEIAKDSLVPISLTANSGYYPDPNSYPTDPIPPAVDASNNQQIRGPVFTDEGSFRDDFGYENLLMPISGTVLFTNGSTKITGINTLFRTELNTNNKIKYINDGYNKVVRISYIKSDTELYLENEYDGYTGIGECQKTYWHQVLSLGGSYLVSDSEIHLQSGLLAYGNCAILRNVDYLPLKTTALIDISQRISGQKLSFGFLDTKNPIGSFQDIACFYFDGYDNSIISCSTMCDGHIEHSVINLPVGLTTNNELLYEIEVGYFSVSFLVNHILVAKHEKHIPKPYTSLYLGAAIWNMQSVESNTDICIENISVSNHNQVQIGGSYLSGEPISIRTSENCFTLSGVLHTESTDANQIILSTTVPAGKMLFITGYCISSVENSVNGNPIKIGKNDISDEPDAPGVINSNFLRIFRYESGTLVTEDFSANPRFLGAGNDIIKVAVTPTGSLKTKWYATLDYVLR
jgi:hypothetical protein